MRSHLKTICMGLASWTLLANPALAELCPADRPEYEVVHSGLRTGGISSTSLYSPAEIAQGERFRTAIAQQGYESARQMLGQDVAPDVAAYVLVQFGGGLELPDSALGDALGLLEAAPYSERRDVTLQHLAGVAIWQDNLELASTAVAATQDPRMRLGGHRFLFEEAAERGLSSAQSEQQRLAREFLTAQPTHRAVLWANLAATAQALGDETQAATLSEAALAQFALANDRAHSDLVYAGPAYDQEMLDTLARLLAQAHQFDVAYALAAQVQDDAVGTELAVITAQVGAGDIETGVRRALALENRSFYAENLLLAHKLAMMGEINCSIAVLLAPEVDSRALYPLSTPLADTLLLWMQAGRQDALQSLVGGGPADAVSRYDLVDAWGQRGEGDTALALIDTISSPEFRYRLLRRLAQRLTEANHADVAAQVGAIADELATAADISPQQPPRPRNYTPRIFSSRSPVIDRTFASVRQRLQTRPDSDAVLTHLIAAREQLLALATSSDFGAGGILLLGEVALALYQNGHPAEAAKTLQQTFSQVPSNRLRSSLRGPTLGDNLANADVRILLNRYEAAGWYAGVAEWSVNPDIGHAEDLNFIFLDLRLTEQGEAIWALAQQAIEKGEGQAAMDLIPYLSREDEQVRIGAMIAAAVMNEERDRILAEDPDSAILQLDLIEADIVPLAVALPDSLLKVRAYLAIAEGHRITDSPNQAEHWLGMAVGLMQRLEAQSGL